MPQASPVRPAALTQSVGIDSSNSSELSRARELERTVAEAVSNIRILRGLFPICASCKKIRDDSGYWKQIESYVRDHPEAESSHSICPDCMESLYPEFTDPPGGEKRSGNQPS